MDRPKEVQRIMDIAAVEGEELGTLASYAARMEQENAQQKEELAMAFRVVDRHKADVLNAVRIGCDNIALREKAEAEIARKDEALRLALKIAGQVGDGNRGNGYKVIKAALSPLPSKIAVVGKEGTAQDLARKVAEATTPSPEGKSSGEKP